MTEWNTTNAGSVKTAGTQRANRPRPLVLSGGDGERTAQPMRTGQQRMEHPIDVGRCTRAHACTSLSGADEMLELMQVISTAVRAGQFTGNLAIQITRLCNQLKTCGEIMEISHKSMR